MKSTCPARMCGISDSSGSFTLTINSARRQTSAASPTISAPCSAYSSSEMLVPRPAPRSTRTVCPARVNASAYRVRERTELIALDAAEAYIDVVRYTRLVELARQNVANHEAIFSNVESRYKGGRSGEGDLQQALERVEAAKAALAEFERSLIVERTSSGRAAAKARGTKFGRKPKLEAAQLKHIYQLVDEGAASRQEIADLFGIDRLQITDNEIEVERLRRGYLRDDLHLVAGGAEHGADPARKHQVRNDGEHPADNLER